MGSFVPQTARPGEVAVPVPQVELAAKRLLEASGKDRVQVVPRLLKEIEELTDPTTVSPNRFRLTDSRIKAATAQRRAASDQRVRRTETTFIS